MRHPDIDLLDPSRFQRDEQHDMFAYLRAHNPVSWHEHPKGRGFWNVVRHRDVVQVSQDATLFSSRVGGINILDQEEMDSDPTMDPRGIMMIHMDPPEHSRYRRLVSGGFTPRALRSVDAYLRSRTALIIDEVIEEGGCEFVRDVAGELSLAALGRLMGFPEKDLRMLGELGDRLTLAGATGTAQESTAAAWALFTYFEGLVESARPDSDDIVAKLVHAEIDGERLSEFELNMFMLMLTAAGQETTRHALNWAVLMITRHPDQFALLRERPDLVPGAIEEILRWASVGQHFRRTATADTEIAGRDVRAGDKVVMWYISANRDEDVFADPFSFSVTRSPNNHVAFGGRGPHFCLGAALARMELRVMLDEVLARMPDVSIAGKPEIFASNFVRGIERMPVRFTPGPRRGLAAAARYAAAASDTTAANATR